MTSSSTLWRITLTGIDESCCIEELLELSRREPRVEFGVLYSLSAQGKPRYPDSSWILTAAMRLYDHGVKLALHVCGEAVERVLQDETLGQLPALSFFGRIQLNGPIDAHAEASFCKILQWETSKRIITQYDQNATLHQRTPARTHQVLFDASGGCGVLRKEWPAPLPEHACGYAGGLGPESLGESLPLIATAAAGRPYWIDMESSLRTATEGFSVARADAVIDAIKRIESELSAEPPTAS